MLIPSRHSFAPAPRSGERYSLVFFTPEVSGKDEHLTSASTEPGDALVSLDDRQARYLAREHSKVVSHFLPLLEFRPDSTDALVIKELMDPGKDGAYTMRPSANMPAGFSVKGHSCVLDVGAHIGVFSRYALLEGCGHIISYEPEPSNFRLLSRNLGLLPMESQTSSGFPTVELHPSAVAHASSESRTLVRARNENSGKANTWRHSLEEYTSYSDVDSATKLPSESQKNALERFPVPCRSFFGEALVPGVTFVKLDCEGAEMEILLSSMAARRASWLDTTHVAVEWSFTKERRVSVFHKAVDNLCKAGFEVFYEGLGSWWDVDASVMWPYQTDIIVFAVLKNDSGREPARHG